VRIDSIVVCKVCTEVIVVIVARIVKMIDNIVVVIVEVVEVFGIVMEHCSGNWSVVVVCCHRNHPILQLEDVTLEAT